MNSLELQPTSECIKRTYCQNTIGRNDDLHRFIDILNAISDNCVIALDGNWGSGKTFFVKQAKMVLDAFNSFVTIYEKDDDEAIKATWNKIHPKDSGELLPQISVYYDAWENDNDDDPLLSIIFEILKSVKSDYSFKADVNLVKIAAAIAELLSGRTFQSLIEAAKQEDPFASIKGGRNLRSSINDFFNSLLPERGDRLIIFIDELDRCNPNFSVRLLERIKHYFTSDKVIFVLAVNIHELQNTVKQYYGNGFDACRYLDRFFDLRITLPPPDMQRYYQSIGFSSSSSYIYDQVAHEIIKQYHFEMREIARYFRLIKIAASVPTHDGSRYDFSFLEGKGLRFCLVVLVPIMIGLKMHDSTRYKAFVEGLDASPLIEIMGKGEFGSGIRSLLLKHNESYEDDETGKVKVKLSDKLQAVYEALFVQEYSGRVYEMNIGQISFDQRAQRVLLQAVSLLSVFADYGC